MLNFREKANFLWSVADLLRGDYKQADYGKVILPLTVLRRLDGLLAPTKDAVLAQWPTVKGQSDDVVDRVLNRLSGLRFHNHSPYDFQRLLADPNHLADNLRAYLTGFSREVRDILESFGFETQIERLDKADLLYQVVKRFGEVDLSTASTLEMGYLFEELIRKFAEASNETAGEHFTPREVIGLMVNLLFLGEEDIHQPNIIRTLYDPTAGTGGMLSTADEFLHELNPQSTLRLFGQEINPESYAICKADMLIKGQDPSNIVFGNTLSQDGLPHERFTYMLANPPFGVDWKKAQKAVEKEHAQQGFAGRFGAGLPRINDGALLFLQHMLAKMRPAPDGGSRLGIVLNGSPLFTGGAGSGESDIRRWIIENDLLEGIVALPDQLFYNTGISTYVWLLTNRKAPHRRGRVQLLNGTGFYQKMSRSLGNKRHEISKEQIQELTRLYGEFREGEFCKIFPNEFFGYRRLTIERPLLDERGRPVLDRKGQPKPDAARRDFENVPLQEDATVYFQREVLPHAPDAWVDETKTKIGYEINFTRYFYRYQPLRPLASIREDILALEHETEGLLHQIL